MGIQTLNSSAFAGQLRDPHSTGISPIFRGRINVGDDSVRCYIKPFSDMVRDPRGKVSDNMEGISEALGYTLAKAAGFQTASVAGFILLKSEQIPPSVIRHLERDMPGASLQDDFLAWFSEDMKQPSLLKNYIPDGLPALREKALKRLALDLSGHPSAPSIVTFDEWTENSDRNLGNILGSVSGNMVLIDHGRIFRLPCWTAGELAASPFPIRNVLKELIDTFTPHWSTRIPVKSARGMMYHNLAAMWRSQGEAAAKELLDDFLKASEVSKVLDFLRDRLEQSHYNATVGLLV